MKKLVTLILALALVGALVIAPATADESYVKLTWVQGTGADAPNDVAEVNEALNVISREKLGVEVDILYMNGEQVLTSVQAGEVYDMYFTCDWYNNYVKQSFDGIFADITEKVKTVTPDLYATMPEVVWELAKVDGSIYAIPVKKDYCPEIFLMFDKEFYESIGMEIPAQMEFADLEPYLAAYQEAHPDEYAFVRTEGSGGIDGVFNFLNRDALIGFAYSKAGTDEATTVISIFEDDELMNRYRAMREWYLKGYINPDAATLQETGVDPKQHYVKTGQGFYGADSIWSSSNQYAIAISKISGPYLSASGVRGSMNALSVTLEDDEERFDLALKYQELVNTDLQYRDTLRYGIEGKHFSYNEDGTVTRTQKAIDDYNPWAFSQGSYALSSVVASDFPAVPVDPNMWDVVFEGYENAIVAADYGFSFDPTPVEMQVAQLRVIQQKWYPQIVTGSIDIDEAIVSVLEEMEAAGLRDVIAEAQAQLDAHLASR